MPDSPGWDAMARTERGGTRLLEEDGLDDAAALASRKVGAVTLLRPDRFHPFHRTERFTPGCVGPRTFGVHHGCGTEAGDRPLAPADPVLPPWHHSDRLRGPERGDG